MWTQNMKGLKGEMKIKDLTSQLPKVNYSKRLYIIMRSDKHPKTQLPLQVCY